MASDVFQRVERERGMKSLMARTESRLMRRIGKAMVAVLGAAAMLLIALPEAKAQEIQITGPLAGAPAVRRLRLHRQDRFDIAPNVSFSLLDEYRRTIMPGLRLNYHFFDWFGLGLFGGYGFQYNAALADELQDKAIDKRECGKNPDALACKRTAVSLCRGDNCLAKKQLGQLDFVVAPQLTFVPFRGKISLFSEAFVDTDISIFVGGALIGVKERQDCKKGECGLDKSFELAERITGAPTFGLGFNFYPLDFMGFGVEYRALPFSWNSSGFDNAGGGKDGKFPDDVIDSNDRSFHFTSVLTVFLNFQLPGEINISD
jgi:hypothetical protein